MQKPATGAPSADTTALEPERGPVLTGVCIAGIVTVIAMVGPGAASYGQPGLLRPVVAVACALLLALAPAVLVPALSALLIGLTAVGLLFGAPPEIAFALAAADSLSVAIAVMLTRRWGANLAEPENAAARPRGGSDPLTALVAALALAVLPGAALSAGVLGLSSAGQIAAHLLVEVATVIFLVPLLLVLIEWLRDDDESLADRRPGAMLIATAAIGFFVFHQSAIVLLLLVIPCIAVTALIAGTGASVLAIAIVFVVAMMASAVGSGPLAAAGRTGLPPDSVLALFFAALVVTALPIARASECARRAERALRQTPDIARHRDGPRLLERRGKRSSRSPEPAPTERRGMKNPA